MYSCGMNDLDAKLKQVIMDRVVDIGSYDVEGIDPESVDAVIPEIKQAFVDEGYITPEQVRKTQELVNQVADLAYNKWGQPVTMIADFSNGELNDLMTNQEWCEKFKQEVDRLEHEYRGGSHPDGEIWQVVLEHLSEGKS